MTDPFNQKEEETFTVSATESNNTPRWFVPEGQYEMAVDHVESAVSKAGNPMFVWHLSVSDAHQDHAGKTLKLWTVTTPAALWKLQEVCVALGLEPEDGQYQFTSSTVRGKKLRALVIEDEYDGNKTSKIESVFPLS